MINEHIEVHLLVQVPIILCVIVLLPWLFPLLFKYEFMQALQMTQMALFGLLFHIMTYPISFMPVSKGDTLTFAAQETVYNVAFVSLTLFGFCHYGWLGAGVGMALARIIDLAVVYSIARMRYGFRLSRKAVRSFFLALLAGVAVMLSVSASESFPWLHYLGIAVALLSIVVSLRALSRHGNLLSSILKRIFKK